MAQGQRPGQKAMTDRVPTLRTKAEARKGTTCNRAGGPVGRRCAGRRIVRSGPEASPDRADHGGVRPVWRPVLLRSRRRRAASEPTPKQRRETGSQRHSTGGAERRMPVNGERECGELPPPLIPGAARSQDTRRRPGKPRMIPAHVAARAGPSKNLEPVGGQPPAGSFFWGFKGTGS